MYDNLNAILASTIQRFNELTALISLEDLRSLELGNGTKRKRVDELLESITRDIGTIERQLRKEVDVPIAQLSESHIAFFRDNLEPSAQIIRRAYLESIGLRELLESRDEKKSGKVIDDVKKAISFGLERWRDMLDDDEIMDLFERGIAIDSAIETVEWSFFEPDRWRENMNYLRPILLNKPLDKIRDHIRHRLVEIYRAFTFGLWMSCIALCRSLLEYVLKEMASRYDIDKSKKGYHGKQEDKSMMELCSDFSERLPSIGNELERVRDAGNRIMHAKKQDVIAFPSVQREEALQCIRSMRNSLETIYAGSSTQFTAG